MDIKKKFKYAKISLIDLCFKCEDLPEIMAEGVFNIFLQVAFPVFPDNGDIRFNRVQERKREDWLYRFMKSLKDRIDEWLECF